MQTLKKCALYALFAALFGGGLIAFTGNLSGKAHAARVAPVDSSSQTIRFDKAK